MPEIIHLHNHSDFSLLDGAAGIGSLVGKAKSEGMSALALTDHGNMFGVQKFYRECKKHSIKPIIGSEFYLAPESRYKKSGSEKGARYHHLVLLARDEQGYRNLMLLSSLGYTEGFYYRPRIDDELLEKYHEGLIALTACLAGEIPRLIIENRSKEALEKAIYYRDLFGPDNFYLELQDHGIPDQKVVIKELLEMSRNTEIPVAATNDIHYIDREDARAQDVLICIGTNKKLNEGKRLKFEYPEFYFKSAEEMARLFTGHPEALSNTLEIAEKCNLAISVQGAQLPNYQPPDGSDLSEYLTDLAHRGLKNRYNSLTDEMKERLDYELSVINSMGYAGYFLIVWDFIHFAKERGIPVGPGRGSGAGSLVAYSLEITDIDPLKYHLIFERFLNPERVSMPDFDIDFCYEGRQEVIDYVTGKYGKEKVGQIITFAALKAKAVIRDVARVLDFPYAEADAIAKLIPFGKSINEALKLEPELSGMYKQEKRYKDLIDISRKLEGLNRHASTHAAGIVISKEELTHYVPLYRDPKTGAISSQYSMNYLEDVGLVKMDFLGLKTLTLIKNTLELLKSRGVELDFKESPENEQATFQMLGRGKSTCIFQFESSGMQGILKKAKPEKIEDLIALNALYRPGPMQFIDQFIEAKRGKTPVKYPLPELESILKETYGVIVYQEQVLEIARKVAGFSLGEADILRRAMGKKKPEEMDRMKAKFLDGARKNGYSTADGIKIFELLIPFAGYGFNKSHAAAYSVLAYQTAYLKANYPAEFMAANLTNEISNTDKMAGYIGEIREMGLEILPPDINLSEKYFSVVHGKIFYGLLGMKNLGTAAAEEIGLERKRNGSFKDLVQFLERVELKTVNRKVVETLIYSGAFDSFKENRATLFNNLDKVLDMVNSVKENRKYGQESLFDEEEGLSIVELEKFEEWPSRERLKHEKEILGFFFSGHPLDRYRDLINEHVRLDLSRLEKARDGGKYTLIGILKELKEIITRSGKRMAFAELEDYRGSIELIFFPDIYEAQRQLIVKDTIVAVSGRVDKSRGDAKLKVETIGKPAELKAPEPRAVHVRLCTELASEENLLPIRDYMIERVGKCAVYFHLVKEEEEVIIKASNQISVSADDQVLKGVMEYPLVEAVWKE